MNDDADGCEFCGFENCSRCQQESCKCPPETGGATQARKDAERHAERAQAFNKAVMSRLLPQTPKELTLEKFEKRMAKRPKVELAVRKDGLAYRKKVGD